MKKTFKVNKKLAEDRDVGGIVGKAKEAGASITVTKGQERRIHISRLAAEAREAALQAENESDREQLTELADQLDAWVSQSGEPSGPDGENPSTTATNTGTNAGKEEQGEAPWESTEPPKDDKPAEGPKDVGDGKYNGATPKKGGHGSTGNGNVHSETSDNKPEDDPGNPGDEQGKPGKSGGSKGQGKEPGSEPGKPGLGGGGGGTMTPIQNPFQKMPKNVRTAPQMQQSGSQLPPQSKEDKLAAIKAVLGALQGGERAGALAALGDILAKTPEAHKNPGKVHESYHLTEAKVHSIDNKTIDELDEKQFGEITDEINDIINQFTHGKGSTKIKREPGSIIDRSRPLDPIEKAQYNSENKRNTADTGLQANKDEAEKYGSGSVNSTDLETFKKHLLMAVADQTKKKVDYDSEDSWSKINNRYEFDDPDVIMPGEDENEVKVGKEIPAVRVYLDCSNSFSLSDVQAEKNAIAILHKLEVEKRCTVEVLYFGIGLHNTAAAAFRRRGNAAMAEIMHDLNARRPANVIFITDSDLDADYKKYLNYQNGMNGTDYYAPGFVWWLFKPYRPCQTVWKHIRSRRPDNTKLFELKV